MQDNMTITKFSTLLLDLYRFTADDSPESFQSTVLDAVRNVLPFDSGLWATGRMSPEGPVAHAVHAYRQPPEMMANYERVKHHDTVALAAFGSLGQTINASSTAPSTHPAVRDHCARFGMAHGLATIMADPVTGLFTAISLYRADPGRPFAESERLTKQALAPHLNEIGTLKRFSSLRDNGAAAPCRALALCDKQGFLHVAGASFAAMLRNEWPEWYGPQLPPALRERLRESKWQWKGGRAIVVKSEALNDLRLMSARRKSGIDHLGRRELEIAKRFGAGMGFRAIANALKISPATVRNHVQAIYAKLGIHNKVALALLLREAGD